MGTVEEEADESMYWMELIVEAGLMKEDLVSTLYQEAEKTSTEKIKAGRRPACQGIGARHLTLRGVQRHRMLDAGRDTGDKGAAS